jgi:hypothetical protein
MALGRASINDCRRELLTEDAYPNPNQLLLPRLEERTLMAGLSDHFKPGSAGAGKIAKTMHEWKAGSLHSGSKKGPKVTSQKQAVAIALSQARKAK